MIDDLRKRGVVVDADYGPGAEPTAPPVTSHESPVINRCLFVGLGLIGYSEAFALQKRIVAARKAGAIDNVLLFCEHPHVITLGRNGKREHLLASEPVLRQKGVEFLSTDRGGDITYHGPGQIVGYPILNLAAIRRDVVWYVRMLEEIMIRATAEFGIVTAREPGKTGIWVRVPESGSSLATSEKLAAIGVHISRWVTSHGFAYNVSTDLRYFDLIVPCGIADRRPTSLEKLLGRRVERAEVAAHLTKHFEAVFSLTKQPASRETILAALEKFETSQQPETSERPVAVVA